MSILGVDRVGCIPLNLVPAVSDIMPYNYTTVTYAPMAPTNAVIVYTDLTPYVVYAAVSQLASLSLTTTISPMERLPGLY